MPELELELQNRNWPQPCWLSTHAGPQKEHSHEEADSLIPAHVLLRAFIQESVLQE